MKLPHWDVWYLVEYEGCGNPTALRVLKFRSGVRITVILDTRQDDKRLNVVVIELLGYLIWCQYTMVNSPYDPAECLERSKSGENISEY